MAVAPTAAESSANDNLVPNMQFQLFSGFEESGMKANFWRFLAVSPFLSTTGFAGSDVPFFRGMGFVPGDGYEFSIANGVSGDGSVVTGTGTRSNNSDA